MTIAKFKSGTRCEIIESPWGSDWSRLIGRVVTIKNISKYSEKFGYLYSVRPTSGDPEDFQGGFTVQESALRATGNGYGRWAREVQDKQGVAEGRSIAGA